jgi:hypothetical protein
VAIGSGLGAQLGAAAEGSYGTFQAPTVFPEFTKESLKLKKTTAQSAGLASGRLLDLSSRRVVTQREAQGTVEMEVATSKHGLLLQAVLGTTVTPAQQGATSAYLQTHILADTAGKSLTLQVGRPRTDGTVGCYSYLGCKVVSVEYSCEVGGMLTATYEFDCKNCDEAQTLTVASYPTGLGVFNFSQMAVRTGAFGAETALDGVRKVSVKIERKMAVDRFYAGQAGLKKEPITNDKVAISGQIEADFTGTTLAALFNSDASTSFVWEFLGPIIASTYPYTFRVTLPAINIDDEPPTVDGPDVIRTTFGFTGLYDLTNLPKIEYMSTDITL